MGTIEPYETAGGRRYRVRYRKPDRGQTDRRGFKTKRAAEEFLASVEVSKLRGEYLDPANARITVGDWSQPWFKTRVGLKPTTIAGYENALRNHVLPRWGGTRLLDVSHSAVQAWVGEMSKSMASATVKQNYGALAGIIKLAIRDGLLLRNPCEGIRLPRIPKSKRAYLSHAQVRQLAAAMPSYGDVILVLAYTGLRWGELAALRVRNVNFERRRLSVEASVTEPGGVLTWGTPKSHEMRSVPFPEFLTGALKQRVVAKHPEDLLFTSPNGGVLRNTHFRPRYFDKAVKLVMSQDQTFPRVTPHGLRHTAASLAVSAGAHVKSLQRMLGHASAAMTLDVYADLFDDDLDAVAEALNDSASSSSVGKMWAETE